MASSSGEMTESRLAAMKLAEARAKRQEMERELQALQNRILLAEQEESKAKIQIIQTDRARSLIEEKRKMNEEFAQARAAMQERDRIEYQRKRAMFEEEVKRQERSRQMQQEFLEEKRREAEALKQKGISLKKALDASIAEDKERHLQEAKKMTATIKQSKDANVEAILEEKKKQHEERRHQRVDNESYIKSFRDEFQASRIANAAAIKANKKGVEASLNRTSEIRKEVGQFIERVVTMEQKEMEELQAMMARLKQREAQVTRKLEHSKKELDQKGKSYEDLLASGNLRSGSPKKS